VGAIGASAFGVSIGVGDLIPALVIGLAPTSDAAARDFASSPRE